MPIYEYRCRSCSEVTALFVKSMSTEIEASCGRCGGEEVERVISSFAYHRSEESRRQGSRPGPDYFADPGNIGRHVEETFEKYGMDIPDSVRETIASAREGEAPGDLDL